MFAPPPHPPAIVGQASVIDGDTLEIHGQRIRLWGIDAPEAGQTCARGRETYRCGQQAALHLDRLIERQPVTCTARGRPDRYRRIVAVCTVRVRCDRGEDCVTFQRNLGAWMVADGWALDYPRYSDSEHAEQQWDAEQAKKGIHAGTFMAPWEWRLSQ